MGYQEVRVPNAEEAVRYTDVKCDNCGAELEPAIQNIVDEEGRWTCLQARNGLHLILNGGYGEYIDPVTSGAVPRLLLCKECAYDLRIQFPGIDRAIQKSWDY